MLIITIVVLMLYIDCKSKFNIKNTNLREDLQREMEEKSTLEIKYNKLLSDQARKDELKKSKDLDEMQVLFTKVNMLDDKLTFFNTGFRSKLDLILSTLEEKDSEEKDSEEKEVYKTPLVDLKERNQDEFENYEDGKEKEEIDEIVSYDDTEEIKDQGIIDDKLENLETEIEEESNSSNDLEDEIQENNESSERVNEEDEDRDEEIVLPDEQGDDQNYGVEQNNFNDLELDNTKDESLNNNEVVVDNLELLQDQNNELNENLLAAANESNLNNSVLDIQNNIQGFDSESALNIDLLEIDDLKENIDSDLGQKVENNIIEDEELNSALKELNNININDNEERKLNQNLNSSDIEGIDEISQIVNMKNEEVHFDNDLKNNTEPEMDGSLDNELQINQEDFLNSDENIEETIIDENRGFNIKDSIDKLKAQLEGSENN